MRPLNRIRPLLSARRMQTYRIARPVATHTRPAACAEVNCSDYVNGWVALLDVADPRVATFRRAILRPTDLGDGIRRSCRPVDGDRPGVVGFRFEAGTPCKSARSHRTSLDRPEIYLVRGGDWRQNTGLIRKHDRPELWVEDMQENLEAVERRLR